MDDKFLNLSGLSLFLQKIKSIFATAAQGAKADTAYIHSQSAHAPSNAERNTIVGIQKNGLDLGINSSRKVNIAIPTRTSELTNDSGFKTSDNNTTYTISKFGNRITLQGSDGTSTYVTDSDTTYTTATTTSNGLMSYSDKLKLDNIDSYANNYIHPSYTSKSNGLYKVTIDSTGHVSGATAVTKSDIIALGIPSQDTNTTYTAGYGLSLSGTQFRHSNSVTAGNRGPTTNKTLTPGTTLTVPQIYYDAYGHVTSSAINRTITLSSSILDTSDIVSALTSATSNSKVLGAKLVADSIENLTDQVATLNENLATLQKNVRNYYSSTLKYIDDIYVYDGDRYFCVMSSQGDNGISDLYTVGILEINNTATSCTYRSLHNTLSNNMTWTISNNLLKVNVSDRQYLSLLLLKINAEN